MLAYGVRDADTGDWIGWVSFVNARGKRLSEGWEYSWEYPSNDEQPDLDPESTYVLSMVVSETSPGTSYELYAVIPIYESGRLWDRVVAALNPTRWAKAAATWVVQGVHGTLCSVVEKATSTDPDNCDRAAS